MAALADQVSEFFGALFETEGFPPRWECGSGWSDFLGWLHIVSDLATWGAYTAIPLVMAWFVLARRDVPFPRIFWLFVAFILSCGTVHLLEAGIFWVPLYRLSAVAKFATAVVSWMTVFALVQVTPKALRLPGIARLNELLAAEVAERREAERIVRQRNSILAAQQEASLDAIVVLDPDGGVISHNRRFCQLWGLPPESCQQEDFRPIYERLRQQVVVPQQLPAWPLSVEPPGPSLAAGKPELGELMLLDGRVLDQYQTPIRSPEGELFGWLWSFRDVTDRKDYEQQLREARDAAQQANQAKTRFLANVSHEIRTPLNGILGMLQLALREALPAAGRQRLELIQESADTLQRVVTDFLDFSKIEAGKIELVYRRFSPGRQGEALIESLRPRVAERPIDLLCEVADDVPEEAVTDDARLRQVLTNLLENALKFTNAGQVTLKVGYNMTSAADGSLEPHLTYSVSDTGVGIPAEKLDRIFRPFEQAEAETALNYGGTGLGLSICSQLVELMGGHLQATSRVGVGSEFAFAIPCLPPEVEADRLESLAEAPSLGRDARPAGRATVEGLEILVVEDNRINQLVAEQMLALDRHRVTIAASGEAALRTLAQRSFDLVLMDVQLPKLDGWETVRRYRAQESPDRPRLPIIAMTARAMTMDRQRAIEAGMDGFVAKPVDLRALREAIASACGDRSPPEAEPASAARDGEGEETAGPTAEPTRLLKPNSARDQDGAAMVSQSLVKPASLLLRYMNHSVDSLREIAELARADLPDLVEQIAEGVAARDSQTVSRAAHQVVGILQIFCIDELIEFVQGIERHDHGRPNWGQLEREVVRLRRYNEKVEQELQEVLEQCR